MALRLKKDVQKASYYVWFLGAQEARGLRGSRVLLPAIPRLVERSNEQEPLKVTLQVSHKGLKIIQGSSKHFIPHSAITCSVQTEDIVACVLLLYNPATRCPLHVHAYRCDSEATAEALNEQLQILINRPENQKRFADLESRLGLDAASAANAVAAAAERSSEQHQPVHHQQSPSNRQRLPSRSMSPAANHGKHSMLLETSVDEGGRPASKAAAPVSRMSSGRFDIGSDTGTSTRESDCGSDEQQSPGMDGMKVTLFDDLAAELREKLNGNGPPLLLPPRDYDTVHRAKGNLAASELRRCQNQMIVGAGVKGSKQTIISSRGSSGIGSSDMAPSPERQEAQTSSDSQTTTRSESHASEGGRIEDREALKKPINLIRYINYTADSQDNYHGSIMPNEDWTNDHQESEIVMQPPIKRAPVKEISLHKPIAQPTQYLYPREPPRNEKFTDDERKAHHPQRQSYRATPAIIQPVPPPQHVQQKTMVESNSRRSSVTSREEEEVRPILTKTRPNYNPQRFREIFRAEEEPPTAPKPTRQHYTEPDSLEQEEFNIKRNIVRRMHSREYESEEAPIKYEKHFPRPNLVDRPSMGREEQHRQSPMEKQKFIRTDSKERERDRDRIQGPATRESKYTPDYYDDESKVTESDRGTTSSLEKFMMRQSGGGKPIPKAAHYKEPVISAQHQHHEKEVTYRPNNDEYFFERNPYREPESQPYRESIEKMLKSPVMRYNSFDEPPYAVQEEERRSSSTRSRPNFDYAPQGNQQRRYPGESPVRGSRTDEMMSEMSKIQVSPQDRFRDAKEKFQKMEKVRGHPVEQVPVHYPPPSNHPAVAVLRRPPHEGLPPQPPMAKGGGGQMMVNGGQPLKRVDPNDRDRMMGNMNSLHRTRMAPPQSNGGGQQHHHQQQQQQPPMRRRGHEWSSEEDTDREREIHRNGSGYRDLAPPPERYSGPEGGRLAPAKSLGNLVKGYRHSYAEPHNMLSRSSGRVGLAAVNPY